jgi:hypothetical protein
MPVRFDKALIRVPFTVGVDGGRTDRLLRFPGHASLELQVHDLLVIAVPHGLDNDLVLALEFAAKQFFGEWVFYAAFNRAAQRTAP